MTFTDDSLVLGTIALAPTGRDADGMREVAIEAAEERILALLGTAYGKRPGPSILRNIRRAAQYWRRGEANLAEIEIALSGLPALSDKQAAVARLALGEKSWRRASPARANRGLPARSRSARFKGRLQPGSAARPGRQFRRRPMDLRRNVVGLSP
ncbi:MAG: hypothetical protein JO007_06605 [Alphaproteobacteria bacterium]|nr:hypothetical protein [Alphaproteobacteria bacterium]